MNLIVRIHRMVDISRMWDPFSNVHREYTKACLGNVKETIRVLIADEIDPDTDLKLSKKLRAAAKSLPQPEDDIKKMEN